MMSMMVSPANRWKLASIVQRASLGLPGQSLTRELWCERAQVGLTDLDRILAGEQLLDEARRLLAAVGLELRVIVGDDGTELSVVA